MVGGVYHLLAFAEVGGPEELSKERSMRQIQLAQESAAMRNSLDRAQNPVSARASGGNSMMIFVLTPMAGLDVSSLRK